MYVQYVDITSCICYGNRELGKGTGWGMCEENIRMNEWSIRVDLVSGGDSQTGTGR